MKLITCLLPIVALLCGQSFAAGQPRPNVLFLIVAATAAALANLPVKPGDLDGVNVLPHLKGEIKTPPHDALYWRWIAQSAIREGRWKLLRGGEREYLYDLAARLRAKLKSWCIAMPASP